MTKATWNYVSGIAVVGLLAGAGTLLSARSANALVYCSAVCDNAATTVGPPGGDRVLPLTGGSPTHAPRRCETSIQLSSRAIIWWSKRSMQDRLSWPLPRSRPAAE